MACALEIGIDADDGSLSSDFSVFSNVSTGASTAVIGGFGGYEPVRDRSVSGTGTDGGPARINNSVKVESLNFGGLCVGDARRAR